MQTLTITNIETKMTKTGNTKVILVCQEGKFYFYRDTKNGPSKAQQQFEKFRFKLGDVIQAEVKTEQKTFTNDQNKEITFNDNWIQYFAEVEGNPVSAPNVSVQSESGSYAKPEAKNDHSECHDRFEKMKEAFIALRDEVKSLRILIEEVAGKKATDLHVALPNRDITEPKAPSLEEAAQTVNSYKSDPSIPTIDALPEGFEDK